ncbi:hypothetical protein [Bradyrhizobium japonicum]|uniref:hypothetical protein n=1 Tax=Bradyrhizobium japonicum TaxID=375 RepID=UPI0020A1BBA7|nr:hypothetical protein [Bradyrhizobium japonicum]MCP1803981.1 hypothetical protein [Bradyrhizobium japonicum]MCP1813004.1 hypothetical protein [Bradyrhizobium japonicum]MCS4024380.1 hypothetical protein [Bradyrhizobium japonicum]MCS4123295.1 hypothetical protein [Bradyrhizobium japonicum]
MQRGKLGQRVQRYRGQQIDHFVAGQRDLKADVSAGDLVRHRYLASSGQRRGQQWSIVLARIKSRNVDTEMGLESSGRCERYPADAEKACSRKVYRYALKRLPQRVPFSFGGCGQRECRTVSEGLDVLLDLTPGL